MQQLQPGGPAGDTVEKSVSPAGFPAASGFEANTSPAVAGPSPPTAFRPAARRRRHVTTTTLAAITTAPVPAPAAAAAATTLGEPDPPSPAAGGDGVVGVRIGGTATVVDGKRTLVDEDN
jgi:hypothetical protein